MALAERYNGEVINSDALQMYEGLPIATNKILVEERKSVPHHLLGCIKLDGEPWNVGRFKNQAIKIIEEIRSRGKLPILVGGTHYYTQSLLFRDSIVGDETEEAEGTLTKAQEQTWPILGASTEEMLQELQKVDPFMAKRWHPNDRKKIKRSLEIYCMTGRRASDIYGEQRKRRSTRKFDYHGNEGNLYGDEYKTTKHLPISPLRYDSLILWTHSSTKELKSRLDGRVDVMLNDGLLSEIESMHALFKNLKSEGRAIDVTQGIWVAIGYKELLPYIKASQTNSKSPKDLESLKQEGITQTKDHTRQYARRQIRWIRRKLIHALDYSKLTRTLFLLDGSDLSRWSNDVEGPANNLVSDFLAGKPLPDPFSISEAAEALLQPAEKEDMAARYCKTCAKTLMSETEWQNHVKGKGHKRAQRSENKGKGNERPGSRTREGDSGGPVEVRYQGGPRRRSVNDLES